ncbi:MAG: hypothetical protein C0631_04675 [Sedimenticola sp.]|jgi:hypothetical protein|nr:MAG: hypothetical protein C0631_04675 [Sedimenticola sp.]
MAIDNKHKASRVALFTDEPSDSDQKDSGSANPWKNMVMDDKKDIHWVTRMVLVDYCYPAAL